ncbi:MAG: hypothetical protein LKJ90_07310 [Faecalibacterium sp.]|jgi:hypothetical protein|nr:hypothetical protein [Faecalibacterium sp.]
MKKELRFYSRYLLEYLGVSVAATLVLIVGLRLTNSGSNLFGTYVSMYPLFVMLFPFCFGITARSFLNLAIGFGAKRMACFGAAEISYTALLAGMILLAKLVELGAAGVPELSTAAIGPGTALLLLAGGFAIVQLGFLLGNIMDSKKRSFWMIMLLIAVMGGAFGLCFALMADDNGTSFVLNLAQPLYIWIVAALLLLGAVLAYFVSRQYRKAVYCL